MIVHFVHAQASTVHFATLCFGEIVLYLVIVSIVPYCSSGLDDGMTTETSAV